MQEDQIAMQCEPGAPEQEPTSAGFDGTRDGMAEIAEALALRTTAKAPPRANSPAPLRFPELRALVASHPLGALFVSVVAGLVVGLALPVRARR